ncbi:MAG: hypothetical protein ACRD3C_10240 [Vicinamibacterales bacterium]
MRTRILRLTTITCVVVATAAAAQAEVCITIDTAHDTFSPSDQAAALLLVTRQFEQAGERVVPAGCARPYMLSHVLLGNTIVVHISGREGQREAIAQGMDDLPALYSQIARSIVTGRPMTGFNVVDRTNVTTSQATARRVHTDSLWYARLGYGSLFGNHAYATPALGFGYRAELDSFAIDVSFLNFQFSGTNSSSSPGGTAQTVLKLSGLYFLRPTANRSAYVGGGLSFGHQSFGGSFNPTTGYYTSAWDGSGLQSELTVGYELARATSVRIFVQADAVLPFYESTAETYPTTPRAGVVAPTIDRRRAPSLVVSIGLGR